jgi:hypothetical protein
VDESTLRLTFPEAIAYLKAKLPLGSTSYKTYEGQLQDVVFAISGITQASLLADIQAIVIRQLETGVTIDAFKRDFNSALEKAGWQLKGDRAYRAELVIQQNVRSAYSAGQYQQMTDPAIMKTTGAWLWRHRDSRIPRPTHKALDGSLLDPNSDFWDKGGWPPCGFGCKCRIFKVSKRELGDRIPQAPPPVSTIVDKGFGFIPGKTSAQQKKQLLEDAKAKLPNAFADLL